MSHRLRKTLLSGSALAFSAAAFAQQPPTGGAQLLQIQPAPAPPKPEPEIRIEPRAPPAAGASDQVRILVDTLHVTGTSVFTERELLTVAGFEPGREETLSDLQRMAARITDRYRRAGYFVAQAFVPAQDIKDRAVTIAVSEGRYGNIVLHNQANVPDRLVLGSLGGVNAGDVIMLDPLESGLLRVSDLPGVEVRSTLMPGSSLGASDLVVDVEPGVFLNGSVDADNAGNRYTGEYRIGATLNVNNPLGLGDLAGLRVLTSGAGLKYGHVSYQLPVGPVEIGVAYDWLDYSLGREFRSLGAHGTAQVATVFGRYAVIRSRDSNLYVQLAVAGKTFKDEVDAVQSSVDRRSDMLIASVYGDSRDNIGGGGANAYGASLAIGRLDIRTPAARATDDDTLHTGGRFEKLSFNASRLQSLGAPFSLYGAVSGQVASKNLDISEKMELGGINGVRAYPEGEAYADQGVIVTLEGRMDLPRLDPVPGQFQLVIFADSGTVTPTKSDDGSHRRTLTGAGAGINWAETSSFAVRSFYAHEIGADRATSAPDRSGRFWIELVKFF